MFNATDEKLINKALGGSQNSWVKIVKRYEGLVYNYCLRMTFNPSDAMDLMQEIFVAVYRNLPSYQGKGKFKAWMMKIASNKSIDFLRHRSRNPQNNGVNFEENDFHHGQSPDYRNPDAAYEKNKRTEEVQKLLDNLPDDQRLIVELKFFQNLTFKEISFQTGVSENTLKSRLYSSIEKLKHHAEKLNVM